MKLLILSLTMIFISFGAVAKDTIYKCETQWFKVENEYTNFLLEGKKVRRLLFRADGEWYIGCTAELGTDSFKCKADHTRRMEYFVLDELTKQYSYKDDLLGMRTFPCEIIK